MMAFNCHVDRSKPTRVGEGTKATKSKGRRRGGKGSKGEGERTSSGAGPSWQAEHEGKAARPAGREGSQENMVGLTGPRTASNISSNGDGDGTSECAGGASAISCLWVARPLSMEMDGGEKETRGARQEVCDAPGGAGGRGRLSSSQTPEHAPQSLNAAAAAAAGAVDVVYPVLCEDCGTQVGVLDVDEVYHFFNVLPSNA